MSPRQIEKRVIIITGASEGLGRSLAIELAKPDNILILCSRNNKAMLSLCSEIKRKGVECYAYRVDILSKSEIIRFIRTIAIRFSKIDLLINNAGAIHKGKLIEKITDEEFILCMKTNLDSVFYTLREVIPRMRKRDEGIIVTISSTAGKRGHPDYAAYSASKFAVAGLMQSTARSLDGNKIRCITIFPAGMNTKMRKYILGNSDAAKQQSTDIVARLINEAIQDKKKFPNGCEIVIRDGKIAAVT